MNSQITDRVTYAPPQDQPLTAYKDWILEIARRLTTEKSTTKFTEAEWTAYWKDFWKEQYRS